MSHSKKWIVLLSVFTLYIACDRKPEPAGRVPTATPSGVPEAPVNTASAASPVASEAGPVPVPTAVPATSAPATTSVASPTPPAPTEVEEIKISDPEGVEFVHQEKWRAQEPNWDMLNRMAHAENAPVLDIVVMHAGVLATADNELDVLHGIHAAHMNPVTGRGWGDISAHYFVAPSGKVYQGRYIWYRADGTVGHGMGRFSDPWGKCAIMLLGDFNNPAQVFTPEAQTSLRTFIEDRRTKFAELYKDALLIREAETRGLMGRQDPFGLDQVRVRKHPSLPMSVQSFLDSDGGTGTTAGDGGTGSPSSGPAPEQSPP